MLSFIEFYAKGDSKNSLKVYATIWSNIINDDITHCDLIKFTQCNAIEKNYISEYI